MRQLSPAAAAMRAGALALIAASATSGAASNRALANGGCRCLPTDACWPTSAEWNALNASVGGRVMAFVDEFQPCLEDIGSKECNASLTDDTAYWLADQPNGLQNTAHFGSAWNISVDHAAYTVRAETEEDFSATVAFAHKHNLRLVVKNTGHDWYGRNTAGGSLTLWTHNRKNLTWHDSYVAPGCSGEGVPAVSVQSGAQFYELYPEAQNHGKIVMGGTCDTVGVAGCWLSGCYGAYTKKFGNGALNMLAARVVLANGTLVTASECAHPDLFWSLRGGGGGVAGVVTEFVARTHPTPKSVTGTSVSAHANTTAEFQLLFEKTLDVYSKVTQEPDQAPNGGLGFGASPIAGHPGRYSYDVSVNLQGYDSDPVKQLALLQPLVDYATQLGGSAQASLSPVSEWKPEYWDPSVPWGTGNGTLPWAQFSGEKGTNAGGGPQGVIDMQSKFVPLHYIKTSKGRKTLSSALIEVAHTIGGASFMTPKGQAGIPAEQQEWFKKTALNPVILDSAGTFFTYHWVPWLAQLPPSSGSLRAVWTNGLDGMVGQYTGGNVTRAAKISALCNAGVGGDEASAVKCLSIWQNELVPEWQVKTAKVRDIIWKAMPNHDEQGAPFSGSYWSETDYFERDYATSYWGVNYPKLLAVKRKYDPDGLFICHNCVGMEFWTAESKLNCRNTSMVY